MTTIHDTVKSESISNNNNHDVNTLSLSPPSMDNFHPINEVELKKHNNKGTIKIMLMPTSNIIAEKDYHSTSAYTM